MKKGDGVNFSQLPKSEDIEMHIKDIEEIEEI